MRAIALFVVLSIVPLAAQTSELFRQFQNPPRTYSVRPFWFWNGRLDAGEVGRQIEEMVAQGVYGAYVHNRTGLETPYLSEEYFRIVGEALRKSKQLGFSFGFVDEYEWPGGEARDVWKSGLPSRVIGANPEFRMRSLWFSPADVEGGRRAEIKELKNFQFAVAGRLVGHEILDGESLVDVSGSFSAGSLSWVAPPGKWRVMAFYLEDAQGRDAGLVDLLNPKAIRAFLDLVHEQYYKRFGEHFGTTMDSIYSDHEGDYGARIAWTPGLFDEFQKRKGYDLRRVLPLLLYEGGRQTPKIRCDYLDVVSELYAEAYFRQVTDWAEAHRVKLSGHLWEETLASEAAFDGDLQRVMRTYSWPGIDTLWENGRSPRDFKATASVAHFRDTRFTVENQGLQGYDSYFDLQKARLGTNTIAAWGASLLIPHAFNYHATRIEYPPDWFYHQPYWKYFRQYADYARRLCFMNDGGRHFADILLFHPTETAWTYSDLKWPQRNGSLETNPLPEINRVYGSLMNRLAAERWDYDIADSHYLSKAGIAGGKLTIGKEAYRMLLLPPMTTVRRSTLEKAGRFYDQGGLVVALGRLPDESMEEGRQDPLLAREVNRIFGEGNTGRAARNENAAGGKAFFVPQDLDEVLRILQSNIQQDVRLLEGEPGHLFVTHRQKEGTDFYWVVNDSPAARDIRLLFSATGPAEKWDAATGARQALRTEKTSSGTAMELHMESWDAFYVVFPPSPPAAPPIASAAPYLPQLNLGTAWRFRPEAETVPAPYAAYREEAGVSGEESGWNRREFNDTAWERRWLSRERLAVREWNLIGPFPNVDHQGCTGSFLPEKDPDIRASYGGLAWKRYQAAGYAIDLNEALGIKPGTNAVAYALTYIYSEKARTVQLHTAANNNAHLWVNGRPLLDWHIHPYYYELRQDFALTRPAELHSGWNTVLLKISRYARGAFGFYFRVTGDADEYLADLRIQPDQEERNEQASSRFAWYRIPVPACASRLQLPLGWKPAAAYYNGRLLAVNARGQAALPATAGSGGVLAIKLRSEEFFPDMPRFLPAEGPLELGLWQERGLPYFSGSASYRKSFELPEEYLGRRLMLDCGQVGSAAELWVNDKPAGVRVWLPYRFDISDLVQSGSNSVRILVTNTMANERAVENHAGQLSRIDRNGLLGPVTITAGERITGKAAGSR